MKVRRKCVITLEQKVDIELKDARVGWRLEGVKNRLPSSESASKRRTLRQKIDVELKDAHVGWRLEGVKSAYPSSASASKVRPLRQKAAARGGWRLDRGQKSVPFVRKCVKKATP